MRFTPSVGGPEKRSSMGKLLRRPAAWFSTLFFNPRDVVRTWRGMPYFVRNARAYRAADGEGTFRIRLGDVWYRSHDRFAAAGDVTYHYFHQDLWAARHLHGRGVRDHVDVGSRLDGFVAHVLPFCRVQYVDIRPLSLETENFAFHAGSITEMPFPSGSVASLSSLHVIEHIGLGRYGDPVDPAGHLRAAEELARVLAPGGTLLLGTPIGRERLCFDAHRVFDPQTVVDMFAGLTLTEFSLVDDANRLATGAGFAAARACAYGCGLFVFRKR
jgi:SAM-dependent methyltransferase